MKDIVENGGEWAMTTEYAKQVVFLTKSTLRYPEKDTATTHCYIDKDDNTIEYHEADFLKVKE